MIKRIIVVFCLVLMLLSLPVSAKEKCSVEDFELQGEFYSYSAAPDKVAEILGITRQELDNYCKQNNIVLLAVDSQNKKQIRINVYKTDFSNSVINLSKMTDNKIIELIPEITGLQGIKGNIVSQNEQKFLRTELKSKDSGGEYLLTQYITVANKSNYILSFYTHIGEDTEYIVNNFEKYAKSDVFSQQSEKKDYTVYIVAAAFVLFLVTSLIIAISIIVDMKKSKNPQ